MSKFYNRRDKNGLTWSKPLEYHALGGQPLSDTINREIYHRRSETIAWNHHSLRPPLNSKEKLTNKVKNE